MNSEDIIQYEVARKIATITINRPQKAHAFNHEMLIAMHERLLEADKDEDVRVILIRSTEEKFFCAGYDLSEEGLGDPENVKKIIEYGRKVNETILLIKKPVVIQVQGIAIGFGFLMIMASDLRIFADKPMDQLYLRLPEIAISAFPQTGATLLPLLAFGLSYARNLLFTADRIGLEDIKNLNFQTRIFPADKLEIETRKFLKVLAKRQPEFLYFIKSMLNIMNKGYIKSCFDLEDECGDVVYSKMSNDELHEFVQNLHKKYPKR